jgi:peptidyl-prolyl cis-trans isomerase D
MENLYKDKDDYTSLEIQKFLDENKDELKSEYIDFKYAVLNPKNLIGLDEFNQQFFDEIDQIENKISQGSSFESIIDDLNVSVEEVKEFTPTTTKKINEDNIYSKRSTKINLIENEDNFLLYKIINQYDKDPDLTDETIKNGMRELVYQKGKFDKNKSILEDIKKNEFDNNKFKEMGAFSIENITINSIDDIEKFESNSVKMLYSLPINSFTLVNDKENKIYLVKLVSTKKNTFSETDENYLVFVNNQNTNTRKTILQSYDQLLNIKYQVQLNQKTIDRVKNYFK